MSASEKIVIDFINQNTEEITRMSISDIATQNSVSTSTVSRAVQKCGISKLTDIRRNVRKGHYIENDIIDRAYLECKDTIESIDVNEVLKAVDCIQRARKIHIISQGVTQQVAKEFEYQLRRCGYFAIVQQLEMMWSLGEILEEGDLVIVLSVMNSDLGTLLQTAIQAKIFNAAVVVCSCKKEAALEEVSNAIVYGRYQEMPSKHKLKHASRLGLHIVVQTIINCLLSGDKN